MSDNLRIWHAVEKTDPNATKNFNRGGGFKGTATNPTYLAQKATELFGPYGIGWGMDLLSSEYRDGHIFDDRGNREVVHVELWRLWYIDGDTRGEVSHYGQTTFVGSNKYGAFTDEEAPKKTKTDAMTKCLALLGFAADVHTGKFDDVKYVNDRRREEAAKNPKPEQNEPTDEEKEAAERKAQEAIRDRIKTAIGNARTQDRLADLWKHEKTVAAVASLSEPMRLELERAYDVAWNQLQKAA